MLSLKSIPHDPLEQIIELYFTNPAIVIRVGLFGHRYKFLVA